MEGESTRGREFRREGVQGGRTGGREYRKEGVQVGASEYVPQIAGTESSARQ